MINWVIKRYGDMKPVVIDGFLYVVIAICGTVLAVFTQEDAYKYVNPYILYWGKLLVEVVGSAATALKMFRSTSYSEHQDAKKAAENAQLPDQTQVITQQQTTKVETKSNETNEKIINPTA